MGLLENVMPKWALIQFATIVKTFVLGKMSGVVEIDFSCGGIRDIKEKPVKIHRPPKKQ